MENSTIEWTDHTFNPWWGCTKVSEGCRHCYAERLSSRFYGEDRLWSSKNRKMMGEKYWANPITWNKRAAKNQQREKVFCASMADVYEDLPDLIAPRQRLFDVIRQTPWLDWILLTKRPENIARLSPEAWVSDGFPDNVWLLTTVENQTVVEKRLEPLMALKCAIKGVSVEPMIGPVDLRAYADRLQWIIVGGETGSKRHTEEEWVYDLFLLSREFRIPFFFKQWGDAHPDNRRYNVVREYPPTRPDFIWPPHYIDEVETHLKAALEDPYMVTVKVSYEEPRRWSTGKKLTVRISNIDIDLALRYDLNDHHKVHRNRYDDTKRTALECASQEYAVAIRRALLDKMHMLWYKCPTCHGLYGLHQTDPAPCPICDTMMVFDGVSYGKMMRLLSNPQAKI